MLNLCTTILNYTEEMPEEYYKYGYITHIIYGRHYPNGGWTSVTLNEQGVTSNGSWPLLTPCIRKERLSDGWQLYFEYSNNKNGLNVTGAPVQEKWWEKPFTSQKLQSMGFKKGEYLRMVYLTGKFYDAWETTNFKVSDSLIEDRIKRYFSTIQPNDYQYDIPHSYRYSRGGGSNSTPTFTARWYMTIFKNKI